MNGKTINMKSRGLLLFGLILTAFCTLKAEEGFALENTKISESDTSAFSEFRKMPINQSGVYEVGKTLFAVALRPYNLKTKREDEIWARKNIGKIISDHCVSELAGNLGTNDKRLIAVEPAPIQLSTRLMLNGKWDGYYAYVMSFKKEEFQKSCQPALLLEHIRNIKTVAQKQPERFPDVVEILGAPEVSMLAKVRNGQIPSFAVIAKSDPKKASLGAGSDTKQNLENLKQHGVEILSVDYQTPILQKVANAQGIVRFDSDFKNNRGEHLPIVKRFFQEGKNLDAAVLLLEAGAENTPLNPEIWEYLEAAYRSLGEKSKAHLACRVWYLLSPDSKEALKKLSYYLPKSEFNQ